jgi:hypothetical protein
MKAWGAKSKFADGKPIIWILMANAHYIDLQCMKDERAQLKTIMKRDISQGASEAWRLYGWRLARFRLVLGDTEKCNDISG